jgi:hypothetical protein
MSGGEAIDTKNVPPVPSHIIPSDPLKVWMIRPREEYIRHLLDDVFIMLRYVRETGVNVDEILASQISKLILDLPLSGRVPEETEHTRAYGVTARSSTPETQESETLILLLAVHGKLSELLCPATPESIRASHLIRNKTLLIIAGTGVISFFALLVSKLMSGIEAYPPLGFIDVFTAAVLGSTFYSLFTANRYIRRRIFNPRYNSVYLVRFVLGIFAGIVLGNMAPELIQDKSLLDIGQTIMAVIGGLSAEAVAQIFQRFSEILVTLVRGSGREQAEIESERKSIKLKTDIASKLQRALTLEETYPERSNEEIKKVIREFLK